MAKSYLDYAQFDIDTAENAGGRTGSQRVENNSINYQLKPSIKDAPLKRRVKAWWVDRENFGEVIAATVSRALTGSDIEGATELVPQVSLVYNQENGRTLIASRYLENVEGTIDDFAKNSRNVKTEKHHVRVSGKPTPKSDTLDLSGEDNKLLRQDLAKGITISILSGDHDVNPGNMMVVKDSAGRDRIDRIDFGHAFNDLLNTSKIFGGQVRNKDNRVLDFLNRETVGHLNPSKKITKLWRDYENIVPSPELAEALKEMADSQELGDGIAKAKQKFVSLVQDLQKDPEANAETLDHVKKSLITINNNVSDNQIKAKRVSVDQAVEQVFNNLEEFYSTGQQQMREVAKLMDTQVKIDQLILDKKQGRAPSTELLNEIKSNYNELTQAKGIGIRGTGIEWVKHSAGKRAFKGDLDSFIKERSAELGLKSNVAKDLRRGDFALPKKLNFIQRFVQTVINLFIEDRTVQSATSNPVHQVNSRADRIIDSNIQNKLTPEMIQKAKDVSNCSKQNNNNNNKPQTSSTHTQPQSSSMER